MPHSAYTMNSDLFQVKRDDLTHVMLHICNHVLRDREARSQYAGGHARTVKSMPAWHSLLEGQELSNRLAPLYISIMHTQHMGLKEKASMGCNAAGRMAYARAWPAGLSEVNWQVNQVL